jgi:hypothetical protein
MCPLPPSPPRPTKHDLRSGVSATGGSEDRPAVGTAGWGGGATQVMTASLTRDVHHRPTTSKVFHQQSGPLVGLIHTNKQAAC